MESFFQGVKISGEHCYYSALPNMVIYLYPHVRMTDIEGYITIYGHSDNLLNNKSRCLVHCKSVTTLGTTSITS